MKNAKNDILRHVTGETSSSTTAPVEENGTVLRNVKSSFIATTDKMGVTTAGSLTRTFFWGAAIGIGAMLAVGLWKDKITFTYSK